ncbi:hypothetical protein GCM10028781_08700 [Nostocoides australiense]
MLLERTTDRILDEALIDISARAGKKPRDILTHWGMIGRTRRWRKELYARLVARGILGEGHDKALGIFRRTTHVEVNPGPERDVRARLNAALLTDEVPDPRTATLIALLVAGDLLSKVLSPENRHEGRQAARAGDRRI